MATTESSYHAKVHINEDDEDVIYVPAVAYYNAILHIKLLPFVRSNNNSLNL